MKPIPTFSKLPFWDIDISTLKYDSQHLFIMERILNFGTWDDYKALFNYYDKAFIKLEVVKIKYLKPKVLNFMAFIYKLNKTDFTCYRKQQFQQNSWEY